MKHTIKIGNKKVCSDYILLMGICLMNEAMIKLMEDTKKKIEKINAIHRA